MLPKGASAWYDVQRCLGSSKNVALGLAPT